MTIIDRIDGANRTIKLIVSKPRDNDSSIDAEEIIKKIADIDDSMLPRWAYTTNEWVQLQLRKTKLKRLLRKS